MSICNARKTNVQKEVGHIIFHSLLEDNATRKLLGIDEDSPDKKFNRTWSIPWKYVLCYLELVYEPRKIP